jgi:hypothetical protein
MNNAVVRWFLGGLLMVCGWAGAGDGLLFSASFEGTTDADIAPGRKTAQTARHVTFVDGYRGKGIRLEPGGALAYERAGNLDLKAGTVMFWFKPEWGLRGPGRITLFAASPMDLYRVGPVGGKPWVQMRVTKDGKGLVNKLLPDLPSGKWLHVSLAWDATRGMWLYFNGEQVASAETTWDPTPPDWDKTFRVMVPEKGNPEGAKTGILDEYRVYGTALGPDRIRAIAMGMDETARPTGPALPAPVFAAPFENNQTAHLASGTIEGIAGVRLGYEPGVSGVGALIKRYAYDQKASLVYHGLPALPATGTISVHISPTWNGDDEARHELLNLLAGDRAISLVKTVAGKLTLSFGGPTGTDSVSTACKFRENHFSHVVVRWNRDKKQCRLFVDGTEAEGTLSHVASGFFKGTWDLWVGSRTSDRFEGDSADAVFDELKIFAQDVAPAAIEAATRSDEATALQTVQPNVTDWSVALEQPIAMPGLRASLAFYMPGSPGKDSCHALGRLRKGTYACSAIGEAPDNTVSLWARLGDTGGRRLTFLRADTDQGNYRLLFDPAVGNVNLIVEGRKTTKALSSLYKVNAGDWNHYAIVRHGGRVSFYINGTYQAEAPLALPPLRRLTSLMVTQGQECAVSDLCVWTKALSEGELAEVFNAWLAPTFAPRPLNAYEQGIWSLGDAERTRTATSEKVCLSGVWRFLPRDTDNLLPPGDKPTYYSRLPGRWITVPYYSVFDTLGKAVAEIGGKSLKRHYQGWYTRYLNIPPKFRGKRLFLSSTYLGANATRIYVNNRLVASYAQKGKNAMGDKRYVLADISDFGNQSQIKVDVFLYFKEYVDRWNTGDVSLLDIALEERPDVFSKDTVVHASATTGDVNVRTTLVNPGQQARTVRVRARIRDADDQIVQESKPVEAAFEAGVDNRDVVLDFRWRKARPWSPESPTLYRLELVVEDDDGQVIEAGYPVRFGFRDFGIRDSNFYLNGEKYHVFYDSSSDGIWMRWSQYYGAYPDKARDAVRTLKGNGFNTIGVRISWDQGGALGRTPHAQQNLLNAADELGMLVVLWAPPLTKFMDEERYRECVANYVRVWGSHPSVVFYLTTFNTCGYAWAQQPSKVDDLNYVPASKKEARSLALRSDAILSEYDPTRVAYHNCSGNLTKLYTTMHYMSFGLPIQEREDWPSKWSRTRRTAFMPSEVGMPYQGQFRDFTYGLSGQRLFVEHAARYFGDDIYRTVVGDTPEMYSERYLADGRLNPVILGIKSFVAEHHIRAWRGYGVSGLGIFGEDGFCYPVNWANQKFPVGWKNLKTWGIKPDKMHIENRWYDLTKPTPYYHVLAECLSPIMVTIGGRPGRFNEKDHAYFSGEEIEKQAIVINDRLEPLKLSFELQLTDDDGQAVRDLKLDGWRQTLVVQPGEVCKKAFRLEAPDCAERRQFHIGLRVVHEGKDVGSDQLAIQVFPREPITALPSTAIGVYDRRGLTRAVFERAGVPFRQVSAVADCAGLKLLVIGRETLSDAVDPFLQKLEASGAIRAGLNVLLFEQGECNLDNLLFEATSQRYVYIKDRTHPVLKGLADADFINWRGDSDLIEPYSVPDAASEYSPHYPHSKWKWGNGGIVATQVIRKPQYGAFRPILDCGFDLMNSPLLEGTQGRGRLLFCQLDVTSRYGTDPVATTLVQNMLDYLTSCPPAKPAKTAYFGPEDSGLGTFLRESGAQVDHISDMAALGDHDTLLVAAEAELGRAKAQIASFVAKGGTVFYMADPKQSGPLVWAPMPVTAAPVSVYHALPQDTTGILRGLGNSDFSWREPKPVCTFALQTPTVVTPTVVASARSGQGRIVFCGIDPRAFAAAPRKIARKEVVTFIDQEVHQKAIRIVTTMLHNLGVQFPDFSLFGNQRYMNNTKSARDVAIPLPEWRFRTDPENAGVAAKWFAPNAQDGDWQTLEVPKSWEAQGITATNPKHTYADSSKGFRPGEQRYAPYDGYAWYRIKVTVPESCKGAAATLMLGAVDDMDWTYVNGVQVGHIGTDTEKYWEADRTYPIPAKLIRYGDENTIAVRVLDIHGNGGLTRPPAQLLFKRSADAAVGSCRSPYVKNLSTYDVNAFHNW